MRRTVFLLTGLFIFLTSLPILAQENTADFFLGKWNVTVTGTPNGDAKFAVKIENKENILAATIIGEDGKNQKVDRVEAKTNTITVYWFAEGYDVYLTMTKKEDGKVEGDLMSMFTAKIEKSAEE